jgi:hypothetical protein
MVNLTDKGLNFCIPDLQPLNPPFPSAAEYKRRVGIQEKLDAIDEAMRGLMLAEEMLNGLPDDEDVRHHAGVLRLIDQALMARYRELEEGA